MLVNMPRRTMVMVKSRTCHQVTSRFTSSDLAEVIMFTDAEQGFL